jgi:hypothetical protein
MTPKKYKRIFISHATKDKFITDSFIDLILDIGLSIDIVQDVFSTSYEGTKIKTGADWRESIKEAIQNAKVVFLFISPHYKESEVCQNEMGAAWVLNSNTIPFMIDPITYDTVGVLTEVKQISKLLDENALDDIKDKLVADLDLSLGSISSARWTTKKKEFIIKCQKYLEKDENKYPIPLTRDEFEKIKAANLDFETTIGEQLEENEKLQQKIEALKKVKDKVAVEAVEKSFKKPDVLEEFENKKHEITKLLNRNSGIINGVIFNDYTRKGLTIEWSAYRSDIDDAIAANEIEIDEDIKVNWENRVMKKLRLALNNFAGYMRHLEGDSDFLEQFEEQYKCDFELNNIVFWKKVFAASVYTS